MVYLQREDLGEPITLSGDELTSINTFVHDEEAQADFSEADILERIRDLIGHERDEYSHPEEDEHAD